MLLPVCLIALGCGQDEAAPEAPPPKEPVANGPPPAWVETGSGEHWLAYSSFCWGTNCATARPPETRTGLPELALAAGEEVRFHLDFGPSRVELRVGDRDFELPAEQVASWRVEGEAGIAVLRATAEGGGFVEYVARFEVP